MALEVSNAPWDGSPSRFTDEQYQASCLLDRGGDSSPKQRCSLPVREPSGTLNRHAMAAAAAALHGGRSKLIASDAQKAAAQRKLDSLYSQAGLTVSSRKAENGFDRIVPLWKDDSQQLVYGVVLTPGIEDSQGDIVDAPEIQSAAHRFLTDYRKHDVQHAEQMAGVETVESFIAPHDMELAGERVLKGSWVMTTHISDGDTWERVRKGELTGFSIGGSGVREPAAA